MGAEQDNALSADPLCERHDAVAEMAPVHVWLSPERRDDLDGLEAVRRFVNTVNAHSLESINENAAVVLVVFDHQYPWILCRDHPSHHT